MTTLEGRPNTALLVIDTQNALTNLYWTYQSAPGRTAEVVTAAEATFTPPAEFSRLIPSGQPGEMPLSGIRWRRER